MKKQLPYDRHARYLTVRLLEKLGACSGWYERMKRDYPHGVKLTYRNVRHFVAMSYPVGWFIDHVCTGRGIRMYSMCVTVNEHLFDRTVIGMIELNDRLARKAFEVLTTEWR